MIKLISFSKLEIKLKLIVSKLEIYHIYWSLKYIIIVIIIKIIEPIKIVVKLIENNSFLANLVTYKKSTNIPPSMIKNKIYENQ